MKCKKCFVEKPESEFYKLKNGKCRSSCKECMKAANRDYSKTERGKEVNSRARALYIDHNPIKKAAKLYAQKLIRTKQITKPVACECCKKETPARVLQAHHDDYSKPDEVRFLCPDCHKAWHNENGHGLNGEIKRQIKLPQYRPNYEIHI